MKVLSMDFIKVFWMFNLIVDFILIFFIKTKLMKFFKIKLFLDIKEYPGVDKKVKE